MASESDWLFESVQQFLQSPSWALPVMVCDPCAGSLPSSHATHVRAARTRRA
jgi:hypothetical protein